MTEFHIDDVEEALVKMAALADSNSHEFWSMVGDQGEMKYKSRHFKEMNRTVATIKKTAEEKTKTEYERGWGVAYQSYAIMYPCSICGGMIPLTPNSEAHKAIVNYLQEKGWAHFECMNR
jgi:hypothetical protein